MYRYLHDLTIELFTRAYVDMEMLILILSCLRKRIYIMIANFVATEYRQSIYDTSLEESRLHF